MKEGKDVKLIRCVDCNEVIFLSSYDFYPEYLYDAEKDIFEERMKDDRKTFEVKHQRHHLEELSVIEGSFISEDLYLEPVKTSYFEVTNGCENFVVKKWRKNIRAPLTYELIPGHLALTEVRFSAQGEDIRKQFQAEVKLTDRAVEKTDHFVKLVQSVISQMDEKDLRSENLCETGNPAILHVTLDEEKIEQILKGCQDIFTPEELKKIEVFIRGNTGYCGVMTALVERQFEIRKSEKSRLEGVTVLPGRLKKRGVFS
jgi:hypothetical protein